MNGWATIAERLIRDVAGDDLDGTPIYLVDGADVERFDKLLASPANCGWTSLVCDLQLAEMLIEGDRWEGRGFATVIYPERCGSMRKLLGTSLHEFAHFLTFADQQLPATQAEAIASSRELMSWIRHPLPPSDYPPERLPPWSDHGADFVRAAAILAYRAGRLLESVRPKHLSFGGAYYPPPYCEMAFLQSLGDDLTRSGSIRDILAEPAPRAFRDRWAAATSWFYEET